MSALPEVRCVPRRSLRPPANFDEWEIWLDCDGPHAWFEADPPLIEPRIEPLPDLGVHVDLAVGEFFRGKWRQRLADAEGDFGHVARQMRKAGVPLDLALVILLLPEELLSEAQPPYLTTLPVCRRVEPQRWKAFDLTVKPATVAGGACGAGHSPRGGLTAWWAPNGAHEALTSGA